MDLHLLFTTRIIRMFCYGFLSVVLDLYLAEAGLPETQIGLLPDPADSSNRHIFHFHKCFHDIWIEM